MCEPSPDKTSVFWDIENCRPPVDVDPNDISGNMTTVFRSLNFLGPISITAFGDTQQQSLDTQAALASSGINFFHIPSGRKDASDKAILNSLFAWASDNPPPANILLISGDRDFSATLHQLRMRTYNVILARPEGVHVADSLLKSAVTVWYWSRLVRAEVYDITLPRQPKGFSTTQNPPQNIRTVPYPSFGRPRPCHSSYRQVQLVRSSSYRQPQKQEQVSYRQPQKQEQVQPQKREQVSYRQPQKQEQVSYRQPQKQERARSMDYPGRAVIRGALEILRLEKMLPTEYNIENCIVYGSKERLSFNMKEALAQGVSIGDLVTRSLWSGMPIFLSAGSELWEHIDPYKSKVYDQEIWASFLQFLRSSEVTAFVNSANQYHAALVVKRSSNGRLSRLALGEIYDLIHIAIYTKSWLKPHEATWSPVEVTVGLLTKLESDEVPELSSSHIKEQVAEEEVPDTGGFGDGSLAEKLRSWLPSVVTEAGYYLRRLPKDFKQATGTTLDYQALGCDRLSDLVKQMPDVVQVVFHPTVPGKFKLYPPNFEVQPGEDVVQMVGDWLPSFLASERDVYDVQSAWLQFERDKDMKLDPQALGFTGIIELFQRFTRVESRYGKQVLVAPESLRRSRSSVIRPSKSSWAPLYTSLVAEHKKMLLDKIPSCKAGYPVSQLRLHLIGELQQRYGYIGPDIDKVETQVVEALLEGGVGAWTTSRGQTLLFMKDESFNLEDVILGEQQQRTQNPLAPMVLA